MRPTKLLAAFCAWLIINVPTYSQTIHVWETVEISLKSAATFLGLQELRR